MMRHMSVRQWARLYGVEHSRERTGLCRYTARILFESRVLLLPNLYIPFGPSLGESLREIVHRARKADCIGGSFPVYLDRQGPGKRMDQYREQFRPLETARDVLHGFFGVEVANALLWKTDL